MSYGSNGTEISEAPKISDACESVLHIGLSGDFYGASFGFSHTAVIVAQGGYAVTGQPVGQHKKRLVVEYFLIPVLRAAAGNHQYCGNVAGFRAIVLMACRPGEGSGHDGSVRSAGESHFLRPVWIRRLRLLRPVQQRYAYLEIQRELHSHLGEGPVDFPGRLASLSRLRHYQPALIGRSEHRYCHRNGVVVQQRDFSGYALGALIRTVEEEICLSKRVYGKMEYKCEAAASCVELAVP